MLALTHFLENAAAGALPLKPFERTFQGLIFADTNLGHCYPSPRSIQWPAAMPCIVNFFHENLLSGHLFFHFAAADNMEMKVMHRLAGVRTAVGNNAVSIGQIFTGSDEPDGAQTFSQIAV